MLIHHNLNHNLNHNHNLALNRLSHPHEQTGYPVKGRIRLFIEDDLYDVHPVDSWCLAGDVEHRAEIIEDSVTIEIFSPAREDYLPENLNK
jgi:quercetin dioxygenase-like cupin family protein